MKIRLTQHNFVELGLRLSLAILMKTVFLLLMMALKQHALARPPSEVRKAVLHIEWDIYRVNVL